MVLIFLATYGIVMQFFNEELHMPRKSPFGIYLSASETSELNRRANKYTLPYFVVVRAKMILMAASGMRNDEIATRLDTRRAVVSQWRQRFFKDRLAGLEEKTRPGRPRFPPPQRVASKQRSSCPHG